MRYKDVYVSLLRYCSEIANTFDVPFLVIDSQPSLDHLPEGDNFYLTGIIMEVTEQHNYIYLSGFLGIKVIDDPNLMRLETKYLDYLTHEIIERKKCIPIYQDETGDIIGHLQFDGTFETTPAKIHNAAIFKNVYFTLLSPQALNTSGNN